MTNMPSEGVSGLKGTANLSGRHTTGSMYSVNAAASHAAARMTVTAMGAPHRNATVKPAESEIRVNQIQRILLEPCHRQDDCPWQGRPESESRREASDSMRTSMKRGEVGCKNSPHSILGIVSLPAASFVHTQPAGSLPGQ